ncbi:hypothetical protein OIU85_019362 [Salix viminalis]|uniref:Uncharacterized protein n=1 Tax=Salix viminalis TaxID=40686 RepID=A0A9Q0UVP7_SALVM|nr:hypothetical protein OIU78_021012 [Salix suchowensis]KAJ6737289.1 hypothetical protein OIU85_019362 [Salix viminalis]
MVEIKFRTKDLLECIGKLDQRLINLKAKLKEARSSAPYGMVDSLQQQIETREKRRILSVYTDSHQF